MATDFGDIEYGGTINKNRGCRKRNMRKNDSFLNVSCV